MSIDVEARCAELIDQFACDNYAVMTLSRIVAQLEYELDEMYSRTVNAESASYSVSW